MIDAGLLKDNLRRVRYGHSPESWRKLWKSVFETVYGAEFAQERVKVNTELKLVHSTIIPGLDVFHMLYWSVEVD